MDFPFDEAPCGLLTTLSDGIITQVNRTFCRWLGREAGDLNAKVRLQELFTVGGRIFHQTHLMPLLQMQGSASEVKLELIHRDGSPIPMVLNAVMKVHAGEKHFEYAIFVAKDRDKYERELLISRRKAEELLAKEQLAQQALAKARQEVEMQRQVAEDRAVFAEQMVAIVSHDLRNPLTVIRMSAHVVGLGELSPNQLRALERISTSTARATRLIADLLDFSRARLGGGMPVLRKSLDLHATVLEVVDDLRAAYPQRVLIHETVGEPTCLASADRLAQMIGNLVANAVRYGAEDRQITIRSGTHENTFSVAVSNEGAAIPAAALPYLFDPLTRGGGAHDGSEGIGLGLYIVREIARAHGGLASATSNCGVTTFTAVMRRFDPDDPQ
jgi:sigma-B regulation protein RsbU (phosphoserine phosphatase)